MRSLWPLLKRGKARPRGSYGLEASAWARTAHRPGLDLKGKRKGACALGSHCLAGSGLLESAEVFRRNAFGSPEKSMESVESMESGESAES